MKFLSGKSHWPTLICAGLIWLCQPVSAQSPHTSGMLSGYTPERVYQSKDKKFSDFEAMLADLARADVVFVGEQHDDPATHRLERAILEGLLRRKRNVTVALEMFERDTQQTLNDYLANKITEAEFLKNSRPWPRYATDYRPLVELAKAHQWRVIAGNVPRRYASQVARNGLSAIDKLPADERKFVAAQNACPFDDYYKRFVEVMTQHPTDDPKNAKPVDPAEAKKKADEARQMTERFYFAQCVKDETMAEAIASAYQETTAVPKPVIVHYNGAFHSDFGLGTAARTKQRLPKANVKIISVVPLEDLDNIKADEYRKRADYVIFTYRAPKPAEAPKVQ